MKQLKQAITLIVFLGVAVFCFAQNTGVNFTKLNAQYISPNQLALVWNIQEGYHLYKDQFEFDPVYPNHLKITSVNYPEGPTVTDNILGTYQIYENQVKILLNLAGNNDPFEVAVTYQGCQSHGSCYPPVTKYVTVDCKNESVIVSNHKMIPSASNNEIQSPEKQQAKLNKLLTDHFFLALLTFLGMGLLLTFTPCVLPMIPILSAVIVGDAKSISISKAFKLSLVYVLSMSLVYAAAGVIFSLLGANIQTLLQNKMTLSAFAILFVALAFSLFGFYEVQLPNWLRTRASQVGYHHRQGSYWGAAIMGALSILILSPCVTPPLIAALIYIAHTGNTLFGGMALFCLGLGMGIPLVIVGTLGGKILPKSGVWMNAIKYLFGFILLALALWIVMRILPAKMMMFLWALYCIAIGGFFVMYRFAKYKWLRYFIRLLAIIAFIYGVLLTIGAFLGYQNPLAPFSKDADQVLFNSGIKVYNVDSKQELQALLLKAQQKKIPVLVDYHADWCMSCKEIAYTITHSSAILNQLAHFWMIKVDVTKNDAIAKQLLSYESVIAPPALVFYNAHGDKLPHLTIDGPANEMDLLSTLQDIAQ